MTRGQRRERTDTSQTPSPRLGHAPLGFTSRMLVSVYSTSVHSTSCLGAYTAAARDARRLRHRRLATTVCRNKREISSKLNLDLDLGQVLGTVKRNEGLYDNLPPGKVGLFGLVSFEFSRASKAPRLRVPGPHPASSSGSMTVFSLPIPTPLSRAEGDVRVPE